MNQGILPMFNQGVLKVGLVFLFFLADRHKRSNGGETLICSIKQLAKHAETMHRPKIDSVNDL